VVVKRLRTSLLLPGVLSRIPADISPLTLSGVYEGVLIRYIEVHYRKYDITERVFYFYTKHYKEIFR